MRRFSQIMAVVILAGLPGPCGAGSGGTTDGRSVTGAGVQKTSYLYAAGSAPPVAAAPAAFIDFGVDAVPVGRSTDGTITLRTGYVDLGNMFAGTPARCRDWSSFSPEP